MDRPMNSIRRCLSLALLIVAATCGCGIATQGHAAEDAAAEERRSADLYAVTFGADSPDTARIAEAIDLWERRTASGDAAAAYYLSAAYFSGSRDALERNPAKAVQLLELAASKAYLPAVFALAWQLETGTHIEKDEARSFVLYRQAAEAGYPLAISRLVRVYRKGELGQSPDPALAAQWEAKR